MNYAPALAISEKGSSPIRALPQQVRLGRFKVHKRVFRNRCVLRCAAICGLLALFLALGCKKEDASANGKPRSSNPTAAEETSTAAIVVPDGGNPDANLNALSMELRRYVLRTMTAPKSFEEFVAKAHVQAPQEPAGKKYAIKNGAVVLVQR